MGQIQHTLLNFGTESAKFGRIWPTFARVSSNLALIGRIRPNLAQPNFGPNRRNCLGSTKFDQISGGVRPNSVGTAQNSVDSGPKSVKVFRNWFNRVRVGSIRVSPSMVESQPNLAGRLLDKQTCGVIFARRPPSSTTAGHKLTKLGTRGAGGRLESTPRSLD